MKIYITSFGRTKSLFGIAVFLLIVVLFNSCRDEPIIWKVDSEDQVIGDYIADNPEQYSEFEKLVELAGMNSLLKIRGPFTVFIPNDEAMMEYYSYQGVGGLEDFDVDFLELLCRNHFIDNYIGTGDIGLGALAYVNGNGDYLASEFEGSDILISKSSKIIKRDIYCSNGLVHVLDKVLDPVVEDIFTVVSSDDAYGIFTEGLSITGLKDTLQIISFPYGIGEARTRFTLLAVADSIYNSYEIYSVEDLIDWCGANPDSVSYLDNPFYRYMEYHCLNGSYYLSDLNTGVYPILSRDNNVAFTIDTDYKINFDILTKEYTGFNIPASNTPAKNGALHSVDDIMPAVAPKPATVRFEATDFFDVRQGDFYQNYFKRFFDGENTFEKVKWRGPYLQYYYYQDNAAIENGDCFAIQIGWWEVSITFPKVMKGKYEVYLMQPPWGDVTDCVVSLDGVGTPYTYRGKDGTGDGGLQKVADADFATTTEHTITVRNIMAGMLFWDWVEFVPVN